MPRADVVVVGAGLAGLSAAIALAEAGATVEVIAAGHAATHWTAGGLDVASPPGAATPRVGIERLAAIDGHPYGILGTSVAPALEWLRSRLAREGLGYVGDLDSPIRPVPTALGGTRRVAIVPDAQAPALASWAAADRLVVCGPARFKDLWPSAVAASLRRAEVWGDDRPPATVDGVTMELPGVAARHNLDALELARRFDDASWRERAVDAVGRALRGVATPLGSGRVALPAVLGLAEHPAVLDAARTRLPLEPFEVPLVPPSVPGLRLYQALRAALRRNGGRIHLGEPVRRIDVAGRSVTGVATAAAVREYVVRAGVLVLATGGIAGGGLVARPDGTLEEPLLGLPVDAPHPDRWLADDPLDPSGHPLEAAGIRVDDELRPVASMSGRPVLDNVRVVGSMIAGQRYLRERCGDGVALTSGWYAAWSLRGRPPEPSSPAGGGTR